MAINSQGFKVPNSNGAKLEGPKKPAGPTLDYNAIKRQQSNARTAANFKANEEQQKAALLAKQQAASKSRSASYVKEYEEQQRAKLNSSNINSSNNRTNANNATSATGVRNVSSNSVTNSNSSTRVTQGFGSASSITQKAYSASGKTGRITAPDMTKKTDGMTYTKIENPGGCTVDDGAKGIKNSIIQVYDELDLGFKQLAKSFEKIAESGVCGNKLKTNINNVSIKCKKQGEHCIARKNEMNELFKYSILESKINELEAKINKLIS